MRAGPHFARRQAGISLIELMVALTIGIFILGGLAALFINMKVTFRSQDQYGQLQDNQRLSSLLLSTTLRSAGYFPNPATATPATALPALARDDYGSMAAAQGIVGTSASAGRPETLTVRYVTASGDGLMNCRGETNTSGATVTQVNIYRVAAGSDVLSCSVDGGVTWTELVSGVQSFSALYLVDRSAAADKSSVQYLDAAGVTAAGLWSKVHSARVTLNFDNPLPPGISGNATVGWILTINLMAKT